MYRGIFSSTKWVPEDFFSWMDSFYELKGLHPPKSRMWRIIYLSLSVPNILTCTVLLISLEWFGFFWTEQDFKSKMKNISSATLNTIVVFRIAMWFSTRRRMEELKVLIRRKSFDFEGFRISGIHRESSCETERNYESMSYQELSQFWRNVDMIYQEGSNDLQSFADIVMFYTRLGCCIIYISIAVICIVTYAMAFAYEFNTEHGVYEALNPYLNKTSRYRTYQYPIYFPFDVSFDGYYWLGFAYNCYANMGSILLFLPIETLITCSIIHLISQVIVIQEAFTYVDGNILEGDGLLDALIVKEFRIVMCINELQEIYRAIRILEDVLSKQLLVQYSFATFILCSVCYIIPLVDTWIELLVYMTFMIASLGEVFIFSYCCQTLALKLQEVAISVYGLDWPNYSLKMKTSLCFLLRRLQKPANLTAGKIINIDLLFFIKVVQKSYSFYTLISNTESKK